MRSKFRAGYNKSKKEEIRSPLDLSNFQIKKKSYMDYYQKVHIFMTQKFYVFRLLNIFFLMTLEKKIHKATKLGPKIFL